MGHASDLHVFGEGGKLKMLYDARQRPQSVLLNGRVYIVYNGDAVSTKNLKASARPLLVSYDPINRRFFSETPLGPRHSDHHFSPVIWADELDYLHVLFGCHKTPGTYLKSTRPVASNAAEIHWQEMPQIAPKLSYPTVYRIQGNRELIYYRTDGHTSSWTYRISDDNGQTWAGPDHDVTDLDRKGRLDWSSYQTKTISRDGRFLHVAFIDYDDNKNSPDPIRFYNPRYGHAVDNEWKYNLSYLTIDLSSHLVRNGAGERLITPIDVDYARSTCQIWDTDWRGAGVPPAVALDRRGDPTFLHVLSEEDVRTHRFYYVRRKGAGWIKTPICASSHQWNSGHLRHSRTGTVHAYVVAGETYLEGGYMDRHGGGRIEEFVSDDGGNSWRRRRVISPEGADFEGWRFNNVQPVVTPDGTDVEGMLFFYGWSDPNLPEARAFLFHE